MHINMPYLRLVPTKRFFVLEADGASAKARKSGMSTSSITLDALSYSSLAGPVKNLGTGDSSLLLGVCCEDGLFERVRDECEWHEMHHKGSPVPRLVCIQGEYVKDLNSGRTVAEPVYRHPADEQPPMCSWSPTVEAIRVSVEKAIGQNVNHVLIQWYRDGNDHISEHADKTLDVLRGSSIVNLSLGATRCLVLRNKKGFAEARRQSRESGAAQTNTGAWPAPQRIAMVNGSLFVLGWDTNLRMLHEIKPDRRRQEEKSDDEISFGGHRISLTFRSVATYRRFKDGALYGQGAPCKTETELSSLARGPEVEESEVQRETDRLISMFGVENKCSDFDWDECYGDGFSVMTMASATSGKVGQSSESGRSGESGERGEGGEGGEGDMRGEFGERPDEAAAARAAAAAASGVQQCELVPLGFFVAWGGVLVLTLEGFPPPLALVKQRLNEWPSGEAEGEGARRESCSARPFRKEGGGSRWPKVTLAAPCDGSPPLSLAQLTLLRDLCGAHGAALRREALDGARGHAARIPVRELSVVHYSQRGLEPEGRPRASALMLRAPPAPDVASEAERARVDAVLEEWRNLGAYLPLVNQPGSQASSYRARSPAGTTLVAFLAQGRSTSAGFSQGPGSSYGSGQGQGLAAALAQFRAAVDLALPGHYAWLSPASLHCTIRALDFDAATGPKN